MKTGIDILVSAGAVSGTLWLGLTVGSGGALIGEFSLLAWLAALSVAIQLAFYLPAALLKTEKFYDLIGASTYLTLVWCAALLSHQDSPLSPFQWCLTTMVSIWALRLGTYLFRRVHREGKDGRFDAIKGNWSAFLVAWTVQGMWCFLVPLPALILITLPPETVQGGLIPWTGTAIWVAGFAIEVIADRQKAQFRLVPENSGKWICSGLWARAQHPNYFGEILLWTGITISGAGFYGQWQWLAVLSPVFTFVLLTRVSGVPMVRAQNRKKWKDDPEYQRYLKEVPLLAPLGQAFTVAREARATSSEG